jgi:hypothetical protein
VFGGFTITQYKVLKEERERVYPIASRGSLNNDVVVMGETPMAHVIIT